MKAKVCIHPNCKLNAAQPHPRQEDGEVAVCNEHYSEIKESLKIQLRYEYTVNPNSNRINWNK